MKRLFRVNTTPSYRRIMGLMVPRGLLLEEVIEFHWTYVDTMPDIESAASYVRSCGGRLVFMKLGVIRHQPSAK